MVLNKRVIGTIGENLAAGFIVKNGYKILARNFRVGRSAEIDIIAKDKTHICFIEVKTRRNNNFGAPCEAVDYKKQRKIIGIANAFLVMNNLSEDTDIRFDIIEVIVDNKFGTIGAKRINIIKNAF